MPTRNPSTSRSLKSEFGDELGSKARIKQPLALAERTEANAQAYDLIKGHEADFQKLITIMAEWQDGVSDSLKIAFRDAYNELPAELRDFITEPRDRIQDLKRGINAPKSELLKEIQDNYEQTYDRLVTRLHKVEENGTEEQIKRAEDEIKETEREERERMREFHQATSINGWSPSFDQAMKFGEYILTSDDVEHFDAIVSTKKLENVMKSVFTPDSISQNYVGGFHRPWARYENEYIVMGVRLSRDAQELTEKFTNKNSEMLEKRRESQRMRDGY
jgi:hypothetical protein